MKYINKLLFFGLALVLAWSSCKKEEEQIILSPNAKLVATMTPASPATLTLLKDSANKEVLTLAWTQPDFGFQAAATYSILIDKKGNNFQKPKTVSVGSDLKKIFKAAELNGIMAELGYTAGSTNEVDITIECLIGAATVLRANIFGAKITSYADILDLSSRWGVVGDATSGGWNGPDLPMYKTSTANQLVAYVTLAAGQIKFRRDNAWTVNLGSARSVEPDTLPTGSLSAGGKNIGVKAGAYRILIDTVANTYEITKFTWGLVGDATPGGWNGPDLALEYDPTADVFRGFVTLTAGQIKFRLNNDWGTNLGATGSVEPAPIAASGSLVANGKNFGVTAGKYLVTLDPKSLKYTFEAHKPWGLVGDATPGGWNGPDLMFKVDLNNKKKWYLNNVVLTAGQIKFREDNAWTNNLGAPGSVEPAPITLNVSSALVAGGKNFGVTAGTWSFELDFTDAVNPKYKATRR